MNENGITFAQLVAFASGDLPEADAAIVESYLAATPPASANAARLREVIETLRKDDSTPPTAEAVRRALAAWSERGAAPDWLRQAERIVAAIVFDSRQRLAVAGFRGPASGFQLAYESPRGRVDLQVLPQPQPANDRWRLRGQVSAADEAAVGDVALVSSGTEEPVAETTPDEHGRFSVDAAAGEYDLVVELDQGRRAIVAPGLAIGTQIE
jgi:anti-sigma factor RsiW